MNNFRRRVLSGGGIDLDPTTGRKMIGNYQVVDLGLPSGLLWATCNVMATNETGYGYKYKWGAGAAYYHNGEYHTGGTDPSYTLPSSADTATQVMGSGWRMPTISEVEELINKTNYKWVTNFNGSGRNGGIFLSKKNPKAYVFFPASGYMGSSGGYLENSSGYFWSSTSYDSDNAYYLNFASNYNR